MLLSLEFSFSIILMSAGFCVVSELPFINQMKKRKPLFLINRLFGLSSGIPKKPVQNG